VRVAVIGHVEWVDFVRVPHVPVQAEILHATDAWGEPGGGGAVAAVQLVKLAGEASFYTALGDDELGRRAHRELEALGVDVHVAWRAEPQRRAVTFLDDAGERTITVIGERLGPRGDDPLPWAELAEADGVYFTAGDPDALRLGRAARVLTATPRALATLREAGVELDALIGSGRDPGEVYGPGDVEPPPRLVVRTYGADGAVAEPGGRFPATPLPGPVADAYGAGDSFAACLTFGLAEGRPLGQAMELAARCGAAALTGRGAFAGQLRHP
jgi:ribokinase